MPSLLKKLVVVILAAAAAAALLAACGESPSAYSVRIPAGEWQAPSDTVLSELPQRTDEDGTTVLQFSVGDELTVINEDSVTHVIGLVAVRPGETVRHVFNKAGTFEGACTLLTGERILIEVG